MVRFVLATEQTAVGNCFLRNLLFNSALPHQIQKATLICLPITALLLICIEHFLSWRQRRNMKILHSANFLEKVGEIIFFRKASQLGHIIETYIHNSPRSGRPEHLEEERSEVLRDAPSVRSEANCGCTSQ